MDGLRRAMQARAWAGCRQLCRRRSSRSPFRLVATNAFAILTISALLPLAGCTSTPRMLAEKDRKTIDRSKVDYPGGFELQRFIVNLTAPSAICFDDAGNILIAESGRGGQDVRIYGFKPATGTYFDVYPLGHRLPDFLGPKSFSLYGPIGGMLYYKGRVYVSHRDENDFGVITALDYTGGHQTIVAGLPAQGENGVTGLAMDEENTGRLFFGVGTATNSGVVGLDDFEIGHAQRHPDVYDIPWKTLRLQGKKFKTRNPNAGVFGPDERAIGAPFQPFNIDNRTTIPGVSEMSPKFNGGIFSISPNGGDLQAEAHGIHYPRGLAFYKYQLFFTNDGMEMRGSRPIKDDPDSLMRWVPSYWYGWPDYTTTLRSVSEKDFQPPSRLTLLHGYPDSSPVIDLDGSKDLRKPNAEVLEAGFPSQSGAAGLTFVPADGPFREFGGSAIVAQSGDRTPFSTSSEKNVQAPIGFKVMRVDNRRVSEFVRNVQGKPSSMLKDDPDQLERPIDVKFGPDGALYILDFGEMRMKGGQEDITRGTGKVYRLIPRRSPATAPVANIATP